jgi:hypothetical protein
MPNDDPRPEQDHQPAGYWAAARQPLQILAFLLPLIVVYELCLALLMSRGMPTIVAHEQLLRVFAGLGVGETGGLFMGGIVIIVVLLVWHVLARLPWHVSLPYVGGMALESTLLAMPAIVLGSLITGHVAAAGADVASIHDLDLLSKLAVSIGAGLYEELVFRMILIAALHTLLVDVAKMPNGAGTAVAVAISAAAFTLYHPLEAAGGGVSMRRVVTYAVLGVYFGVVYLARGFGIVVGVHATYDVIVFALNDLAGD